jgi:hypothetical protein
MMLLIITCTVISVVATAIVIAYIAMSGITDNNEGDL